MSVGNRTSAGDTTGAGAVPVAGTTDGGSGRESRRIGLNRPRDTGPSVGAARAGAGASAVTSEANVTVAVARSNPRAGGAESGAQWACRSRVGANSKRESRSRVVAEWASAEAVTCDEEGPHKHNTSEQAGHRVDETAARP